MITAVDWGIWIVYLVLIYLILMVYRNSKDEEHFRYFLPGFLLKVLGGVSFALIYVYYYGFGDTFLYHEGASVMADTLVDNPRNYFRLLGSTMETLPADLGEYTSKIRYIRGGEEWFMVKLLSPLSLLSFKSYLVTTLFMSTIAFFGSWKLYQVFRDILPNVDKWTFAAAFLIPSVMFWGSGIMKDTLTLAAISMIIYWIYFSVFKGKFKPQYVFYILIAGSIIFSLKGYIIISFVPALLFGLNEHLKKKVGSKFLRRIMAGVLILSSIGLLALLPQFLSDSSSKYNAETLEGRVKGFHTWHTDVGGSTYNLGEIDYSLQGVISKIPAALNVTFFRPYLWEARNPFILIAAVESLAMFFLFLVILFRMRMKIFKFIREQPILLTMLLYSLIFGFVVGFTSYNFGALGRYKIPVFSLFAFLLFYLNSKGGLKMFRVKESS